MTYETRPSLTKPDLSDDFVSKKQIGWVNVDDLSRIDLICRDNPPPEKQFDGPRRIDKTMPLRRCQEWTRETIQNLEFEGVLHAHSDSAGGSSIRDGGGRGVERSS